MYTKTYEIHNFTTGEILVNNLKFEDVPELFEAYASFYADDDICVCYREIVIKRRKHQSAFESFKSEWFNFMDEVVALGNFFRG